MNEGDDKISLKSNNIDGICINLPSNESPETPVTTSISHCFAEIVDVEVEAEVESHDGNVDHLNLISFSKIQNERITATTTDCNSNTPTNERIVATSNVNNEKHKRPKSSRRRRGKKKRQIKIYAGAACRYPVVKEAARKLGWKLVDEHSRSNSNVTSSSSDTNIKGSCNVLWIDTSNVLDYLSSIKPWQRINHFPGMINIARKTRLAENLLEMKHKFHDEYSFFPTTFILPRDFSALRESSFFNGSSTSSDHHHRKSKSTFIVKPDGGCQGRGIFLTRSLSDMEGLKSTHVAQKYIANPLLIEDKKFDLRIYVLVTSCDPLRIYIFRDGLVRLCTQKFVKPTESNMSNQCMHLTNYSINKRSDDFEEIEYERCNHDEDDDVDNDDDSHGENIGGDTGSKRSIRWFLSWIASEIESDTEKRVTGKEAADRLWGEIGDIVVKTIISIAPTLKREYNTTFGLNRRNNSYTCSNGNCDNDDGGGKNGTNGSKGVGRDIDPMLRRTASSRNHNKDEGLNANDDPTIDGDCGVEGIDWKERNGGDEEKENQNNGADGGGTKDVHANKGPTKKKLDSNSASFSSSTGKTRRMNEVIGSRCFAILGFDVMICSKMKPHLIEVNHLPSFAAGSKLDYAIKSKVCHQALSNVNRTCAYSDERNHEAIEKQRRIHRLQGGCGAMGSFVEQSTCSNTSDSKEPSSSVSKSEDIESKLPWKGNVGLVGERSIEEIVTEIYATHAPEKLDKVKVLLHKYKGHEEWLLKRLQEKYEKPSIGEDIDLKHKETSRKGTTSSPLSEDDDSCFYKNPHLGDEDLEQEYNILVEGGDFDRIYPPFPYMPEKMQMFSDMLKCSSDIDIKQQRRLTCPLWQQRLLDKKDEDNVGGCDVDIVDEGFTSVSNTEQDHINHRGDWLIHGNIHTRKRDIVVPTRVIHPPTQKQIEAFERLSKGFSSLDNIRPPINKGRGENFMTKLTEAEKVGRKLRKRNENKGSHKSQLMMSPVNIEFANLSLRSTEKSYNGDRCYVDFRGTEIGLDYNRFT